MLGRIDTQDIVYSRERENAFGYRVLAVSEKRRIISRATDGQSGNNSYVIGGGLGARINQHRIDSLAPLTEGLSRKTEETRERMDEVREEARSLIKKIASTIYTGTGERP